MKGRLFKCWNRVRSSFWFIPAVMSVMAMALAIVSVALDQQLAEWFARNDGWTFTGGAEGASAVLAIIAGSMIAITGVVFSMTLVTLSLASSQLGPRLLRTFMRDASTQDDLRLAIATVVLEHLLEHHFDRLFPRVEALAQRDANIARTVSVCAPRSSRPSRTVNRMPLPDESRA